MCFLGEVIQMESNQDDEAKTFTCRCGKVFNGAHSISRHCKRCKFVPFIPNADEDMSQVRMIGCLERCISLLISN
jgi:hypothetical protein